MHVTDYEEIISVSRGVIQDPYLAYQARGQVSPIRTLQHLSFYAHGRCRGVNQILRLMMVDKLIHRGISSVDNLNNQNSCGVGVIFCLVLRMIPPPCGEGATSIRESSFNPTISTTLQNCRR